MECCLGESEERDEFSRRSPVGVCEPVHRHDLRSVTDVHRFGMRVDEGPSRVVVGRMGWMAGLEIVQFMASER